MALNTPSAGPLAKLNSSGTGWGKRLLNIGIGAALIVGGAYLILHYPHLWQQQQALMASGAVDTMTAGTAGEVANVMAASSTGEAMTTMAAANTAAPAATSSVALAA